MIKTLIYSFLKIIRNVIIGVPVLFFWLLFESTESIKTVLFRSPDEAFFDLVLMLTMTVLVFSIIYEALNPIIRPILRKKFNEWIG